MSKTTATKPPEITQEFLKSILSYNPLTGIFIFIKHRRSDYIGKTAGFKNRRGYIKISINSRRYPAHRLAFLFVMGIWPENQVDHRDRDKSNNIWLNLRECTNSQNQMNSRRKISKSGYRGVIKRHKSKTFIVRVGKDGKYHYGGNFSCPLLAAKKYNQLALEHHGEFAQLNTIEECA